MQVKYLGENGENIPVSGAVAICSPWDLLVSVYNTDLSCLHPVLESNHEVNSFSSSVERNSVLFFCFCLTIISHHVVAFINILRLSISVAINRMSDNKYKGGQLPWILHWFSSSFCMSFRILIYTWRKINTETH